MAHRSNAEEVRIASRRAKVAALLVRGVVNQFEIARQLGMEASQQSTISRDMRAIKEQWRTSSLRDFDEAKGRELEKLEALEAEAWAGWERSKAERTSSRTRRMERPGPAAEPESGNSNGTAGATRLESALAELKKEQRDGSQAFLLVALKCVSERCKILGLHAPVRHRHGGDDTAPPVRHTQVTVEDVTEGEHLAEMYRRERFGESPQN
jgi:hypothetical protein